MLTSDVDAGKSDGFGECGQEEWGIVEEWRVVKDIIVSTPKFISYWLLPSVVTVAVIAIIYRVGTHIKNR